MEEEEEEEEVRKRSRRANEREEVEGRRAAGGEDQGLGDKKPAEKEEADSITTVGVRCSVCFACVCEQGTGVGEWQGVIRNVTY